MKMVITRGVFKKSTLIATAFVLALGSFTAAVPFILSKTAAAAPVTVLTTDLSTWYLGETRSAGHNELVAGGLHVWTEPSGGSYANEFSKAAGYYGTPGVLLSDINSTAINFASYSGVRPSVQLGVDRDGNGSWDGYLVYEPWAYGDGQYWVNKPNFGVPAGGGYTSMGTLAEYQAANPSAKVTSIGYSLGSGVIGDAVISSIVIGETTYTFNAQPQAAPTNLLPSNGTPTNNAAFSMSWNVVPGATKYEYRTANTLANPTTLGPIIYSDDSSSSNYSINATTVTRGNNGTPENDYYWQVRAGNAGGQWSDWSAISKVTTDYTPAVVTGMTQTFETAQNGRYAVELTFNEQIDTSSLQQGWSEVAGSNKTKFVKRYYSTEQFSATFKDIAGNSTVYTFTITPVVNNAPVVNFVSPTPANNAFVKGTVTTKVNATDDWGMGSYYLRFWKDAYEVAGGGTLVQSCFSAPGAFLLGTSLSPECAYDTTAVADNTKLVVSAQFLDGQNAWGNAALLTYTVDNTAPTITVKTGSSTVDGSQGTNPYSRISFKLYDAAGNLKEVDLNGNIYNRGGQWNDLNWVNITKSQLIEGENTIIVRDKAGNQSSLTFTYDSTAPAAPVLTARAPGGTAFVSGGATNSYDVVADWNDVADASSYIYKYWNAIPGNPYTSANPYTVNGLGSSETSGVFNQGEGTHYMQVFAVDAAGNVSAGSNIFEVRYDVTTPTAAIQFPAIGSGATSFEVQYSEAVSATDATNPANYYLTNWIGAGGSGDLAGDATVVYDETTHKAVVTFTSSDWYVSPEQLWGVQNVRDLAGNLLTPNPTEVYSTPNVAPNNPGTPTANSATSLSTEWSWTAATDPNGSNGSGIKGYEYKSNGATDWTFTTSTSVTTVATADGTYSLVVRAVDNAGNTSGEVTGEVTIDATPAQPSAPTDTEADGPTTPVAAVVTTFAATPTIVGPGFTNVAVLGQDTDNTSSTNTDNGEVEGASTLNTPAQAVDSEANQGTFMGLAWYWWLLIIAAIAALAWWIIAAIRRRQAGNAS